MQMLTRWGAGMGIYLNPGSNPFRYILSDTYVDKTGLIEFINGTIGTPRRMTCVSRARRFGKYMNELNVICIDITWTISMLRNVKKVVSDIESEVIEEIRIAYPDCVHENETALSKALMAVTMETGRQFFFIIDEWDALFREAKDDNAVQKEYIQLLRSLFKGGPATDEAIAGDAAINQIREKRYTGALSDYNGEILLVGINYDKETKKHSCEIEKN
ncbi:MAG: hypothetical protein LUC41_00875 [Clostridiales bacterium]|nr:hypothetical protein [Clostridiales bacterium]